MKAFIFISVLLYAGNPGFASNTLISVSNAIVITVPGSEWTSIMTNYFDIKNALVAGNATVVASKAADLKTAITQYDVKQLTEKEMSSFIAVQPKLAKSAKKLSASADLNSQREIFAQLSEDLRTLSKSVKLTTESLYVDYCPMKKAYWLSDDPAIKNPYFGSAMLNCGSIKETIE